MLKMGWALLDVMQQDNDSQAVVCTVSLHDFQCFAYAVMLSITLIGCFHFAARTQTTTVNGTHHTKRMPWQGNQTSLYNQV